MRIEDLKILLVVVCTLTPLLVNCQVGFTREQILQEKERLKKESVHIGFWLADQVIPNLESHGNLTTFIAEM